MSISSLANKRQKLKLDAEGPCQYKNNFLECREQAISSSDLVGRNVFMLYCTGIWEVEPHKQPFCLQCQLKEAAFWFLCSLVPCHAKQVLDLCHCHTKTRPFRRTSPAIAPALPSLLLVWHRLWNMISDDNRVQFYSWCHPERRLGWADLKTRFCMMRLLCSMADRQFVSLTRGNWGMQLGVGFPHYL